MENIIDYKKLGEKLKQIREERGISFTKARDEICISNTHFFNIEKGKVTISLNTLIRLLNYYNLSLSDILPSNTEQNNLSYDIKKEFLDYDSKDIIDALDYLSDFLIRKNESMENKTNG